MLTAYATVLVFLLLAAAIVLTSRLPGRFVRSRASAESGGGEPSADEPGDQASPARFDVDPRLYLVALVFLIFDVAVAFIVPVAVVFQRWAHLGHGMGARAFAEIFVFIAVLLLGLLYAWKKGDLDPA